jgi:hypothetical protein
MPATEPVPKGRLLCFSGECHGTTLGWLRHIDEKPHLNTTAGSQTTQGPVVQSKTGPSGVVTYDPTDLPNLLRMLDASARLVAVCRQLPPRLSVRVVDTGPMQEAQESVLESAQATAGRG